MAYSEWIVAAEMQVFAMRAGVFQVANWHNAQHLRRIYG
jgi:hypothetical protein